MASYEELKFDWSMLCQECSKWTKSDLQLAAELGKTLLERNKELEGSLKAQQSVIGEQTQEIDFLTKQAAALREVNDSRLRIYENIEVSIHDLESENHRLLVENGNSKKHNKTLLHNIECLEGRCEEMTRQMDDLNRQIDMERRKNERLLREKDNILQTTTAATNSNNKIELKTVFNHSNKNVQDSLLDGKDQVDGQQEEQEEKICFAITSSNLNDEDIETLISNLNGDNIKNENLVKVLDELVMTKRQYLQEQRRVSELEEQLNAIIQENQTLQSHISKVTSNEEMKSMHDELSILEEVRQGKMCSRCMRTVNDKITESEDGVSSMVETEDGNDSNSFMDLLNTESSTYRTSVTIKEHQLSMNNSSINDNNNNDSQLDTTDDTTLTSSLLDSPSQNRNPYRELVEKYEALLEIHNRNSINRNINNNNNSKQFQQQQSEQQQQQQYSNNNNNNNNNTSIKEDELTSGDFSSINTKDDMDLKSMRSSSNNDQNQNENNMKRGEMPLNNGDISNNGSGGGGGSGGGNRGNNGTRMTPTTDFSEAETSSSGFLDETSNKCTQTDETFLCTIADGDDKFSIYDDAGPIIDARFRNRPEYRELFKEIFAILKKAAENKDDGEKLPLLDDSNQILKVPPVTPAVEELPMFPDDTESVISSVISEQSIAMSERITKQERKEIYDVARKHIDKIDQIKTNKHLSSISGLATTTTTTTTTSNSNGQSQSVTGQSQSVTTTKQPGRNKLIQKEQLSEEQHLQNIIEGGRILTPYKRQPLEYLAVSVNVRKRNKKKGKQLSGMVVNNNGGGGERSNSPNLSSTRFYNMGTTGSLATSSTIGTGSFAGGGGGTTAFGNGGSSNSSSGRKRREFKSQNNTSSSITNSTQNSPSQNQNIDWNGTSMTIYNRHACGGANNNNAAAIGNQFYSPATSSNYSYKSRGIGGGGAIRRQNNSATDIGDFDVSNSDLANYRRTSTASQDLHKLIKLDLSYAEVLRRADQCKQHNAIRRK